MRIFHLFFREVMMVLLSSVAFYYFLTELLKNRNELVLLISLLLLFYIYSLLKIILAKHRQRRVPSKMDQRINYTMIFLTIVTITLLFLIREDVFPSLFSEIANMKPFEQVTALSLLLLLFFAAQPKLDNLLGKLQR